MASHVRPGGIDVAPTEEPADAAYDRDFYSWSLEQARHLRAGLFEAVDRENVAEEIESPGREQFNKLESAFRAVASHAELGPPVGTALPELGAIDRNSANRG